MIAPAKAAPGILIVDDHELVRLGLCALIASHTGSGTEPVATLEASTLADAIHLYARHAGSIVLVLLDLHLPDTHGLSGLREFLARFPAAPIVVLSGDADPALKRQAREAGAHAFLPKAGQLTDVIDYLAARGLLDPARPGAATVTGQGTESHDAQVAREVRTHDGERLHLTRRQAEMLDWLLAGRSNREIAEHVHLAEGTVKNHVSALLLMFGVRSRAELISRLR
ncbi:response regulator transcription factor [Ottowia sp.]|uniref:response regulator transcription factor n=1 Tax=Ottowia sp. TaxID=1898956 RepID=UPI002BF5F94D|nr:response regulator transcription factor [Ottowia sp.]HRN77462.1 response regulator transcription factor [Ottowia sp.]HRQ02847.1 response regulator transcription factor [Ottowia sp.]